MGCLPSMSKGLFYSSPATLENPIRLTLTTKTAKAIRTPAERLPHGSDRRFSVTQRKGSKEANL